MNTVTKAARRSTRLVYGGARDLTRLARKAHRANRRAARQAIRRGDTDIIDTHNVTAWDIS